MSHKGILSFIRTAVAFLENTVNNKLDYSFDCGELTISSMVYLDFG